VAAAFVLAMQEGVFRPAVLGRAPPRTPESAARLTAWRLIGRPVEGKPEERRRGRRAQRAPGCALLDEPLMRAVATRIGSRHLTPLYKLERSVRKERLIQ